MLAADLVAAKVAVIVVLGNTHSAVAAKAATDTIPIVFRIAVDPVQFGLVARMNQPGGNLTGVTTLGVEVGPSSSSSSTNSSGDDAWRARQNLTAILTGDFGSGPTAGRAAPPPFR